MEGEAQRSQSEIATRREAALKRMLNTPPQPHNKTAEGRKSQKAEKPRGRPAKPKSA